MQMNIPMKQKLTDRENRFGCQGGGGVGREGLELWD